MCWPLKRKLLGVVEGLVTGRGGDNGWGWGIYWLGLGAAAGGPVVVAARPRRLEEVTALVSGGDRRCWWGQGAAEDRRCWWLVLGTEGRRRWWMYPGRLQWRAEDGRGKDLGEVDGKPGRSRASGQGMARAAKKIRQGAVLCSVCFVGQRRATARAIQFFSAEMAQRFRGSDVKQSPDGGPPTGE